ncbi:hypothetical protein PEC106568_07260 [Pectobacterium carotovorum subsp. carotovorum]|nr:hypothetical protein PEC106568_07260 [Pectobacterium carotovorum subsp. carotovorum]
MIIAETENCDELLIEDLGYMLSIGVYGMAVDTEQARLLIAVLQRWLNNEDIEDL